MRLAIFLAAVCVLFWWALVHDWLPPVPPEAASVAPQAEQETVEQRLEPVRRNLRDVTPENSVRLPRPDGEVVVRLPAVQPPPPPPRPPRPQNFALPAVVEAGVVETGGETIRFAGVEPVPADRVCNGESGDWPCGAFARTALQRFLRRRTIECEPGGEKRDGILVTRCELSGQDIGEWLVGQGWAQPADSRYREAGNRARAARLGIWGGGPSPVRPEPQPGE